MICNSLAEDLEAEVGMDVPPIAFKPCSAMVDI